MSQRVFRWMYRIFFTDNCREKTNISYVIMCKGKYCRRKKVNFFGKSKNKLSERAISYLEL
jgi:hypothetical protein